MLRKSSNNAILAIKKASGSVCRRLFTFIKTDRSPSPSSQESKATSFLKEGNRASPPSANCGTERNGKPAVNNGLPQPPSNPFVPIRQVRSTLYWRVKVIFDRTLALLILLLTAPVILAAMALVKLTSRGPALYTQTRVGMDGKPFTIYKIRSMTHQCEDLTGAQWSKPGDSRITPLGRLLRQTHLDELPQLWNVLRGDMSLIGPRPERPEFVPQLEKAIPLYKARLLVRPGVTGLAQVQLPPDTNLESVRIKIAYDIYYIGHLNLLMDFRILMSTALKLIHFPFSWIRRLCCFAARDKIQTEYDQLIVSGPAGCSVKQIQTA